jgi:hypothetical protein
VNTPVQTARLTLISRCLLLFHLSGVPFLVLFTHIQPIVKILFKSYLIHASTLTVHLLSLFEEICTIISTCIFLYMRNLLISMHLVKSRCFAMICWTIWTFQTSATSAEDELHGKFIQFSNVSCYWM